VWLWYAKPCFFEAGQHLCETRCCNSQRTCSALAVQNVVLPGPELYGSIAETPDKNVNLLGTVHVGTFVDLNPQWFSNFSVHPFVGLRDRVQSHAPQNKDSGRGSKRIACKVEPFPHAIACEDASGHPCPLAGAGSITWYLLCAGQLH
jgi:hypothetical protein